MRTKRFDFLILTKSKWANRGRFKYKNAEKCATSVESSKSVQVEGERYYGKRIVKQNFELGQMVLFCNSRFRLILGKLKFRWSNPFTIKEKRPYGTVV